MKRYNWSVHRGRFSHSPAHTFTREKKGIHYFSSHAINVHANFINIDINTKNQSINISFNVRNIFV